MESDLDMDGEFNNEKKASNETEKENEENPRKSEVSGDEIMDPTLDEYNNGANATNSVSLESLKSTVSVNNIELLRKLNILQEKANTLRENFSLGLRKKRSLRQQQVLIQESKVSLRQNNVRPSNSNGSNVPYYIDTETSCSTSNCSTKFSKSSQDIKIEQQHIRERPREIADKTKDGGKPRLESEVQLQAMRELLHHLMLQNPQLETKVQQLVSTNTKFKNLDLFSQISDTGSLSFVQDTPIVHKVRSTPIIDQPATNEQNCAVDLRKKRRNSIASNSNSSNSLQIGVYPSTSKRNQATNSGSGHIKRKERKKRGKRNKSNKNKNRQTEQEALENYLKAIVQNFVKYNECIDTLKYIYKPDEEDLETYAQRLAQAGFGQIVEDEIRVNWKNNRQSFVMMSSDRESAENDGIILLPVARQYAFEGDIVRAFVMNARNSIEIYDKSKKEEMGRASAGGSNESFEENENPSGDEIESLFSDIDYTDLDATLVPATTGCPKAFVIKIVKKIGKRDVVGTVSFKNITKLNDEQNYYKVKPHDMRKPMMYIPVASCDGQITSEHKQDVCGFLYVVRVRETNANGYCIADLHQPVGRIGNLEAEISAILAHNDLMDVEPYEERFNEMFAQPDPPITASDLSQREDLRKKCIFTIDPLTAKDLDDALSIDIVSYGVYEVGVHISDVSYYLQENSELDNIVKYRATSIYLVNEVIHMLPKPLCFKCSLLPGEDKFAFSVFWRIKLNGEIIDQPRFTRSIINSCTQFAYEHAQKIIDNPQEDFDADDFPTICNGFTPNDITSRVILLNTIAKCLRAKRYDGGALSINNPKLRFITDPVTGEPVSYEVDARLDANFLIEEFMLLANQSVAHFIYHCFPEVSILRNHAPPLSKSLKCLKEKLAKLGIDFDCSSSKAIYESMQRICATAENPKAMDACLNTFLTKPMARAKYFCSEGHTKESDRWHYALSIPIYTHFTSPIRRYPDILVHRVLAASLDYCPPPERTIAELHELANICNSQKWNAKNAGDESTYLFFKRYIKSKQSITLSAVVIEILRHVVNVVTIETGHAFTIDYKIQKVDIDTSNLPAFILISEKNSKRPPLELHMFSTVDIKLVIWDDKISSVFASPDPKQRQINCIKSSKNSQTNITRNSFSKSRHSSNSSNGKHDDDFYLFCDQGARK